jgi:hypothetical protein
VENDDDDVEEFDESEVDAELEAAALQEVGEYDEQRQADDAEDKEILDEDEDAWMRDEELQQRNWFRDEALHTDESMEESDIGDQFAKQRYRVPEQIQHKCVNQQTHLMVSVRLSKFVFDCVVLLFSDSFSAMS